MSTPRPSTAFALGLLASVLCPRGLRAEVSLQVLIEPPEPRVGQVFRVVYGVQVHNDSPVQTTALEFDGLEVLSNPGGPQFPPFGMIGGANVQITMSSQVEYLVRAPRAGRFTIRGARAISIVTRRVVLEHPPVVVVVREANQGPSPPPQGPQPGVQPGLQPQQFPGFPGFPQNFPLDPQPPSLQPQEPSQPVHDPDSPPTGALSGAIFNPDGFIRYGINTATPYVGQEVILRAWLYVPAYDAACEPDREPVLNGFWSDVLIPPRDVCAQRWIPQNVHGSSMSAGMVRKIALYPTHAGRLEIGPMAMYAEFVINDGFLGTRRRMNAQSPAMVLDVREPPSAGRPPNFVPGLMGPIRMTASMDRTSVSVGETVTLTLEAVGNGYIGSVALPTPSFPEGIRSHAGASNASLDHNPEAPRGTLRVSHLLVPTRPGSFALAPLSVPWLDATTGRYETAQVELPSLTVTGTALESDRSVPEADPSMELEPVLPAPSLDPPRQVFTTRLRALFAMGFLPLAIALVSLLRIAHGRFTSQRRERHEHQENDPRSLLARAHRALDSGDFAGASQDAGRGLEKALKNHSDAGLDESTRASLREAQRACDAARFAGQSSAEGARALVAMVLLALDELEKTA